MTNRRHDRSREREATLHRTNSDRTGLLTVLLVIVVLGATFGARLFSGDEGANTTVHAAGFPVPGGRLDVVDVSLELIDHAGMNPNMPMPDPVPEGQRRVVVNLTLLADDKAVAYRPSDLSVRGDGLAATPPVRAQAGPGTVPARMAVDLTAVFQIPEALEEVYLSFNGGAAIPLDLKAAADGTDLHPGHAG